MREIATQTIVDRFFFGKKVGRNAASEVHYDLRTRHARLWGKSGPYIHSTDEAMRAHEKRDLDP